MWYRKAIDFGKLFGSKPESPSTPEPVKKPDVPNDVFREYFQANIPNPPFQIETRLPDHHLILTGAGDIHQGVSHKMFLDRILDATRNSISSNPELREKYNTSRFPEYAYGPDDLVQRRNEKLEPGQEKLHPEDAVTEILHDYFDQGIRISNMAGYMAVNAIHLPSLEQIRKLFDIINLLQPEQVAVKIVTDKGTFQRTYNIKDVDNLKGDILQFKIHGPTKDSKIGEWRRY
jgi:hypothetical protein